MILRYRKNDPAHNFIVAANRFVTARGGKIIVAGPIQLIRMPGDGPGKFKIAVSCIGKYPDKPHVPMVKP